MKLSDKNIMRKLLILLIFLTYSCSSLKFNSSGNYRETASFAQFAKSCKSLVGDIFKGTTKSQVKKVLTKLDAGEKLTESESKKLLHKIHEIPFLEERVAIQKKLEAGGELSYIEKKTIRNFIGRDIVLGSNTNKSLYKKQYFGGDESMPLSYGLEFELKLSENPAILNSYRVKGYTEEQWFAMPVEKRLSIAKEAQKNQNDIDHFLLRLSNANPKLPEGLFIEPHGTIEGNDMIFDNLGDFNDLLSYFVEHFEAASFQSHVVLDARAELDGLAGYTVFEYDRAQLASLENGYKRYLKDNTKIPAQNLTHHSLGPIDETIAERIKVYEENLADGVTDFKTQGTKAVFAPNFRVNYPYGEGKMGFELRQFHKRDRHLFDAMAKLANDLENYGNLSHYKDFSETPQTSIKTMRTVLAEYGIPEDKMDDFELFFISLNDEIVKSIKAVGGARGGATLENRLLYPLRDWKNHPVKNILSEDEVSEFLKITDREQRRFITEIESLMDEYGVMDVNEDALKKVQVLISSWSEKSDYSKFFQRFSDEVKGEKRDVKYSYLPELNFFTKADDHIAEKTERSIPVYKYKNRGSEDSAYTNYLDNTFEVAFRDIGDTGHIELRVGKQKYSINGYFMGSSSASKESFSGFGSGATGRVYRLDRTKIKELNEQVAAYINSVKSNNFPPFDVWGGVEQVEKVSGGYKIVGKSKNKATIKAEVVEENGLKYFKKGNVLIPAIERNGELHIQTTNCTQGVMDILRTYMDMDLGNYPSAGMLHNAFTNDSVRVPYEAIIQY
jgi:hypothetical protein